MKSYAKHRYAPGATLLALCACSNGESYTLDLPESVTHVGALELVDETVVGGTALLAWDPERPIELAIGASSEAILYGFDQAQLEPLGGRVELIESTRLEPADDEPCALRLPDADWTGRWVEDGSFESFPPSEAPVLFARWLEEGCHVPDSADLRFDLRGAASPCEIEPSFEPLGPCRQLFTLCPASREPIPLIVGPDGPQSLCVQGPTSQSEPCTPASFESPAIGATECPGLEGGVFDVLDASSPPEPTVEVTRFIVSDVPIPDNLNPPTAIFDFLVRPDRVLVSGSSTARLGCPPDAQNRESTLESFDPETGLVIASATAPPCLSMLAESEGGDDFFGTFFRAGSLRVGRFDASGNELASVALAFPGPIDESVDARGLERVADGTLGILIARQRIRDDSQTVADFSRLHFIDDQTLSPIGSAIDFSDNISTPMFLSAGEDEFLASGGWSQKLLRISPDSRQEIFEFQSTPDDTLHYHSLAAPFAVSDGTIGVTGKTGPVRFVPPSGERWEEGPVFEQLSVSTAIEWPAMGEAVLLLFAGRDQRSEVFLIDTKTRRLSGPMSAPGGRVRLPHLRLGPGNRAWALDPGQASLTRFDAL